MKHVLLYGLQRSGTNYLQTLLTTNFEVKLEMDPYTYSLPIHKHFRPYSKPWFFPHLNLLHDFKFESFNQFDEHCQRLTKQPDLKYVVVAKEPYSWYLSYSRFAKKESIFYYMKKKYVNQMYLIDYSLYFKKWLDFIEEGSEKILLINYESLLKDFDGAMGNLKNKFGFKTTEASFQNTSKVRMSKKFSAQKRDTYLTGNHHTKFRDDELLVLTENLNADVVEKLGYKLYYPRGIKRG
jgi:hypothetical protein